MLRNRFYIGEVLYKGEICPGPQPALIERELFDAVQARLTEQRSHNVTTKTKSDAPLRGILFDAAGNAMVPTHATKQGVRYRYYVSLPYLRGITKPPVGAIVRVPATELETAVQQHLSPQNTIPADKNSAEQRTMLANISRVEVRKSQLAIWVRPAGEEVRDGGQDQRAIMEGSPALLVPWIKPPTKRFREILLPAATTRRQVRPIKFERRAALLKSIARGRTWLDAIVAGTDTVEELAARHKCSVRHINMTISMAFIAPGLVKAAVEGRLPRGIGVANLREAPAEWSLQYRRLGLPPI
jgi:hypothetical protein